MQLYMSVYLQFNILTPQTLNCYNGYRCSSQRVQQGAPERLAADWLRAAPPPSRLFKDPRKIHPQYS